MACQVSAARAWECVHEAMQFCVPAAASTTKTESKQRRQKVSCSSRRVTVSKHGQRHDLKIHSDTTNPTTVTILAPREEYADGTELEGRKNFTLAEFFDRNNTLLDGGSEPAVRAVHDASSPSTFISEFQNASCWEQEYVGELGVTRFCEGVGRESNGPADGDAHASEHKQEQQEKKGIPAVMRCFDRTKIYVNAGNGGNGVVAFRREKYVPYGGPAGGNGGEGGSVYIEVDPSMNSLLPFRKRIHFRAGRGGHGQGKCRGGAKGEDCVVRVPPGTLVKAAGAGLDETEAVLLEMTMPGERVLLLPGGRGGRGNAAFKSGRNRAPQLAENGEEGAEMWVELELKLVADVGIIGVPNAGKSTLLSSISSATPNIADYPFTTLLPNLGVVSLDFDASMLVADLPGLLEGAHSGVGLGHEFLRHAERCYVLVHVIDGTSPQPVHEYEAIRLELSLFNPALALKPSVVAFNKMDISDVSSRWQAFKDFMQSQGVKVFCISAATKQGTSQLIQSTYDILKLERSSPSAYNISGNLQSCADVGEIVRSRQRAPIETFWVTCDQQQRTWQVHGAGLERFTQMTNWEYFESVRRFNRVLVASGVSSSLRDQGVQEGDTVIVGQREFIWHDSDNMQSLSGWKRGSRGSRIWPH